MTQENRDNQAAADATEIPAPAQAGSDAISIDATPEISSPSTEAVEVTAPAVGQPSAGGLAAAGEGGAGEGVAAGEDDAADDGDDEPAEAGAEVGDGVKKKRKRKRKKKKPATESADRKPQAFTHLFEGQPRAHAFRSGEVVAGRVERVEHGVIVVDLFGKAVAFADELEPREVPVIEVTPVDKATGASIETSEAEALAAEEAAVAAEADVEAEVARDAHVGGAEERSVTEEPSSDEQTSSDGEFAAATEGASDESDDEDSEELAADEEAPAPEPPELGGIFRGRVGAVAESGHIVLVNRVVDVPAAKARIAAARDARKRVRGVVYGFNRGGFDVLVEGIRTFCPAGGMTLGPVGDPADLVGRKLEFTLPVAKGSGKSIIVSRRGILERDLRKAARQRLNDLEVGQRFQGAVTQVRDYGLLVDLGDGLEGLVHQSEVSWSRAARPADVANVGDQVEVEVLKVQPATRKDRTGRVSLSMRRCQPDPWEAQAQALKAGVVHKGTVTRTAEFGAFVLIAPEIEGLLHISELGDRNLKHAGEVLNVGDSVDVMVERVDREARRVSLSRLSAADVEAIEKGEFDPELAPKSLKPGNHVVVVVERVENHGVLAQVKGLIGRRGRAYLPNRELSAEGADRKKAYGPGKELTVKIIGIDRDGGLKCSVKGRLVDEERRAVRDYRKEAAKQGFGTFGDLLRAKISDDSKS